MKEKLKANIWMVEIVVLVFMFVYILSDIYNDDTFKKKSIEVSEKMHQEGMNIEKQFIDQQNQIIEQQNQTLKLLNRIEKEIN